SDGIGLRTPGEPPWAAGPSSLPAGPPPPPGRRRCLPDDVPGPRPSCRVDPRSIGPGELAVRGGLPGRPPGQGPHRPAAVATGEDRTRGLARRARDRGVSE